MYIHIEQIEIQVEVKDLLLPSKEKGLLSRTLAYPQPSPGNCPSSRALYPVLAVGWGGWGLLPLCLEKALRAHSHPLQHFLQLPVCHLHTTGRHQSQGDHRPDQHPKDPSGLLRRASLEGGQGQICHWAREDTSHLGRQGTGGLPCCVWVGAPLGFWNSPPGYLVYTQSHPLKI